MFLYFQQHGTISTFNHRMTHTMEYPEILALICAAHEFANIRVREEELSELDMLKQRTHMPVRCVHGTDICDRAANHSFYFNIQIKEGVENAEGKINVLLQACAWFAVSCLCMVRCV